MADDRVTMADYIDDVEPGDGESHDGDGGIRPVPPQVGDPNACDHCGRSFDHLGVRASKVCKKHEQRCQERDADD